MIAYPDDWPAPGPTDDTALDVVEALQARYPHRTVEYMYPGVVAIHLGEGRLAKCGGRGFGWYIVLEAHDGREVATLAPTPAVADDETDAARIAGAIAAALEASVGAADVRPTA